MGLFNRKKKKKEETSTDTRHSEERAFRPGLDPGDAAIQQTDVKIEEQIAALAVAAAIQTDDIAAVVSAAVAAYEEDTYGGTINGIPAAHVAAITAAIAEIDSGDTTGDRYDYAVSKRPEGWQGLYVRRIRRVSKSLPAWGVAGNREVIDSRRM